MLYQRKKETTPIDNDSDDEEKLDDKTCLEQFMVSKAIPELRKQRKHERYKK